MIDDESDLRQRFAQLRAQERPLVPRFNAARSDGRRPLPWRPIALSAVLVLVVILARSIPSHPTRFSESDRAVVRSIAAWHPPTDFLLQTPGNELLKTTPHIPDLKGIHR